MHYIPTCPFSLKCGILHLLNKKPDRRPCSRDSRDTFYIALAIICSQKRNKKKSYGGWFSIDAKHLTLIAFYLRFFFSKIRTEKFGVAMLKSKWQNVRLANKGCILYYSH